MSPIADGWIMPIRRGVLAGSDRRRRSNPIAQSIGMPTTRSSWRWRLVDLLMRQICSVGHTLRPARLIRRELRGRKAHLLAVAKREADSGQSGVITSYGCNRCVGGDPLALNTSRCFSSSLVECKGQPIDQPRRMPRMGGPATYRICHVTPPSTRRQSRATSPSARSSTGWPRARKQIEYRSDRGGPTS
jgi:hypothetical protein